MRTKRLAVIVLIVALGGASARAAFQEPISSPESAALGHTSLTASRDSASLFSNPAQLAGMQQGDFYFMYNQMYSGLAGAGTIGQGFISGALPTRLGAFGFGVGMFQAAGLYQERTMALTYARRLGERLEIGVTGKQLYHSFMISGDPLAAADPVFRNGRSASALALDFGIVGRVSPALRLGLAVRNANRPNVGLAVADPVPREIQGGLAYEFAAARRLRLTADLAYRGEDSGVQDRLTPALGLEKGVGDGKFVFRCGVTPLELTAGFGLRWGLIGLDYALVLRRNLLDGNFGTHMLGLRVRFGGSEETVSVPREALR